MANHFDRHYCGKCGLTYVYNQKAQEFVIARSPRLFRRPQLRLRRHPAASAAALRYANLLELHAPAASTAQPGALRCPAPAALPCRLHSAPVSTATTAGRRATWRPLYSRKPQEPEFVFQQAGNGQADGDRGVEEPLNGHYGMLQKGKGSVTAETEQDQPEFEFQRGSLEALVRPVNVVRPLNGEGPKNDESDAFLELQDSMSVATNTETDEAGAHERWWKPSSPLGMSVGTPGAEFYDAFEDT
nr:unnamed protein product [Digitaria exilis]